MSASREKPVYFASKTLTDAQWGYVAIELEWLAVAWAMEKFLYFPYASHFILETNQKALEAILSKSINQAYQITNQLCARSDSLQQIRIATQEDDELALLKHTITQGWSSTIKEVPSVLLSYWTFRDELMVEDGIILKGTRIVMPAKKCEAVLKLIHEGHLGLNKCKLQANETVYWPGLNDQLENLVLYCEVCLKYSQSNCKQEPNMSLVQEIPLHPWSKLVTDLFYFEGASYLLIVDYTSRFLVVHKSSSMTGQHVAIQCKLIFSEYGWPETLISDNGPCYTVDAFTSVMNTYHVKHITSSPHYPQSNGLAEKYVQIVKSLFYKAKEEGKDLFRCLLIYCITSLSGSLESLMQILQSRSTISDLPMSNAARQQLDLQPEKMRNVNKNEHLPSHDLHIGQDVMYQDATSKWCYIVSITSLCV